MQFTDAQLGVIIGGVVGALLLLAIVFAVGTYCKRRFLRRREIADEHPHKPEVNAGDLVPAVEADAKIDADTMFGLFGDATAGNRYDAVQAIDVVHPNPRPSSQFGHPTYLVSSAAADAIDQYAPWSSLVFPSAATSKFGPGVVRPVSWASSFPEPSTLGLGRGVVDGSSSSARLTTSGVHQQSSAENFTSYGENVVQTPSTAATSRQSDDVYGGMVMTRDSGNWSWTAAPQSGSERSWITVDSKYINQQRQLSASDDDEMTTSAFDSVEVDFTVPTAGEQSRRPVITRGITTGASDPYVARASVISDGDRLRSATAAAASDPTRQGDTAKTNGIEDGAARAFVGGFRDERGGVHESQASFDKSSATPTSRDTVTSSSSLPYMATARTDGFLAEQSSSRSDHDHRFADAARISSETQPGNNSTAQHGDVIDDAAMRSALAEWERQRKAARLPTLVVPSAAAESMSYLADYQPGVDRWRHQLERLDQPGLEYSAGRQATDSGQQPTRPSTESNFDWPATQRAGGSSIGIGGGLSRETTRNYVDANDEHFETRLPTRSADTSSGFQQQQQQQLTQFADRKQIAIGGAYASSSQSAFSTSSPFADLDRQLQHLQLERQRQDGGKTPADRQVPGGSRSPTSFIRSDNKPKTDAGDKELIGDAFKFLDEFDE